LAITDCVVHKISKASSFNRVRSNCACICLQSSERSLPRGAFEEGRLRSLTFRSVCRKTAAFYPTYFFQPTTALAETASCSLMTDRSEITLHAPPCNSTSPVKITPSEKVPCYMLGHLRQRMSTYTVAVIAVNDDDDDVDD